MIDIDQENGVLVVKNARRLNIRVQVLRLTICSIAFLSITPCHAHAHAEKSTLATLSPKPQMIYLSGKDFTIDIPIRVVIGRNVSTENATLFREILSPYPSFVPIKKDRADSKDQIKAVLLHVSDLSLVNRETKEMGVSFHAVPVREGYILMIGYDVHGHKQIVIVGADPSGIYYGEQTLSQILGNERRRTRIPAALLWDWPTLSYRGIIEGFYGKPWSQAKRMHLIEFCSHQKMNTYVYAPKDDPFHRNLWRIPYSPATQKELGQLISFTRQHHMRFVFALSPGNSVSYTSETDLLAMIQKNQAMWDEGVRDFAIFFDDIGHHLTHPVDRARFGNDSGALARAQADFLNQFYTRFIQTHPGAELITVPTDYYQSGHTPYRDQFAREVNKHVSICWTGDGVIAKSVSVKDLTLAKKIFRHPLLLWDNYPVNDYLPSRLFLGPLEGRAGNLGDQGLVGMISNPMIEAEASKIALHTIADYTWNPLGYNAKQAWENALRDIGGRAYTSLRLFAWANRSSPIACIDAPSRLDHKLSEFLSVYRAGKHSKLDLVADDVRGELQSLQNVPKDLALHMNNPDFIQEMLPWFRVMSKNAFLSQVALEMLLAQRDGDLRKVEKLRNIIQHQKVDNIKPVVVPMPELRNFMREACAENDRWLGQESHMRHLNRWFLTLLQASVRAAR
ncbi:beta-N-acetylhexosaminidase family protein [Ferroacidibacillus organovorans]|nr:beta-N-acetylglucosaminidase domain-containing protein [Ferroacidibacillus organovorans]